MEAKEKNPNLEDMLLKKIMEISRHAEKISFKKELADLDLGDPMLKDVFYKMLRGTRSKKNHDAAGYPPLTDFITVKNEKKQISVYLASQELLFVLFDSKDVVNLILDERKKIHTEVTRKKDGLDLGAAAEQLKSFCANKLSPDIDPELVSFNVSKSDPKKYN
jgi:hypothetical protein